MSRPFADESVFRAISHTVRRKMLDLLRERERPVSELVSSFMISRVAISHHLRVLRMAGLVHERRNGRGRAYAIHAARLREIEQWIGPFARQWNRSRSPA